MKVVWALLNLILALAGIVLGVVSIMRVMARKKRKDDSGEEEGYEYETEEQTQKRERVRLVWFVVAVAMAVLGILVFLLTEDMTLPMVFVDEWTIVNAIILLVEIVSMVFAFKRKKESKDEEQQA